MDDNCEEMIKRLYGAGNIQQIPYKDLPVNYKVDGVKCGFMFNGTLVPNIICADGLKYDYSFGRCEVAPINSLFDWNNSQQAYINAVLTLINTFRTTINLDCNL